MIAANQADTTHILEGTLMHELTHHIESLAPAEYEKMKKYVMKHWRANNKISFEHAVSNKMSQYKGTDTVHGKKDAADEIMAEWAVSILQDEKAVREFLGYDATLGQKITDAIKKFFEEFTAYIKSALGATSPAYLKASGVEAEFKKLWLGAAKAAENGTASENGKTQYQIVDDIVSEDGTHFGQGTKLEVDIFEGKKESEWGKVARQYLYDHAGMKMTMYDDSGNPESVYIARKQDRMKKEGANNSHKVIDKMARRSKGLKALIVSNTPNIVATSKYTGHNSEHVHQWLDENSWMFRKAYVISPENMIYEMNLNIADGRERNILYDINLIKEIGRATLSPEGDSAAMPTSTNNVSQEGEESNTSDENRPRQVFVGKYFLEIPIFL